MKFRKAHTAIAGLLALSAALSCPRGEAQAQGPGASPAADGQPADASGVVADLSGKAQATRQKLANSAARWRVEFLVADSGTRIASEVLWDRGKRKVTFTVPLPQGQAELFKVLQRDGLWYVSERGRPLGKYCPREAPFSLPTAYLFLDQTDPLFVDEVGDLGRYEGTHEGVASFRRPADQALQVRLRRLIGNLETNLGNAPQGPELETARRRLADVKALLEEGQTLKVDAASGMLIGYDAGNLYRKQNELRFLQEVPAREFAVEAVQWEDFSGDPTQGVNVNELAIICHSGVWRPGMPETDYDGRLVNLRTGQFRRIPFRGSVCTSGCFLPGRTKAAVSGTEIGEPGMGLYEVDLRTGRNRRLGGELLKGCAAVAPVLSPDGKTLAAIRVPIGEGGILDFQVCLVDVATGEARKLGKPMDTAFLSWLPTGKALLLVSRETPDPRGPTASTISRMDLDGRITSIRPGHFPLLLADGKTILFRDGSSRLWKTCDLQGKNVSLFADGLERYAFPAVSPDGKSILWIWFGGQNGPRPAVIDIGSKTHRAVTDDPGLWANPSWR